eukprot:5343276-Pleurochrysis_carterae.AAC.2
MMQMYTGCEWMQRIVRQIDQAIRRACGGPTTRLLLRESISLDSCKTLPLYSSLLLRADGSRDS